MDHDLLDILKEKNIEYEKTNNPVEIQIRCTSGEHEDKHPSLSFNLEKNVFNCFSCGFSGGINKFLESIGISTKIPIDGKQPFKIRLLKQKLREIKYQDQTVLPSSRTPVAIDFKNVSAQTIKEFDAFLTSEMNLEDYLCFPIYQFNRLRFIEGRYRITANSNKKSKYIRKPAGSSTIDILFPLDKLSQGNTVILVEGIFDMLNLWDKGYKEALCIFGVNNFSKKKVEILDNIGKTRVLIMMDGDIAGRSASVKISRLLEQNFIKTERITLPADRDPGSLNAEELQFYLGNYYD